MALSFVTAGQGDLTYAFFRDVQYESGRFVGKDGTYATVLLDALAWADIRFVDISDTGDHVPIVAEVTAVGVQVDRPGVLTLRELGLRCGG